MSLCLIFSNYIYDLVFFKKLMFNFTIRVYLKKYLEFKFKIIF